MVLKVIKKLNIKVNFCNTMEDSQHAKKLLTDTNRSTVPCLYIDGTPMHESRDIINWLEDNRSFLTKN